MSDRSSIAKSGIESVKELVEKLGKLEERVLNLERSGKKNSNNQEYFTDCLPDRAIFL